MYNLFARRPSDSGRQTWRRSKHGNIVAPVDFLGHGVPVPVTRSPTRRGCVVDVPDLGTVRAGEESIACFR